MTKADQVMEKVAGVAAGAKILKMVTKGLKKVDKGIRTIGRKSISGVKKTKMGKKMIKSPKMKGIGKKISKKLDARKKLVQRAVGGSIAGGAAYGTKKLID